ncbi:MAG TPA: hypothetical protein PKN75_09930 [Bacteroidia bacterium]|nr:hypothetical protein [Bacteroidia bacterium]HNU33901.1 hypothetical protein [Bacteroidia bacterium]
MDKKLYNSYTDEDKILLRKHLVVEAFTVRRELNRPPLPNELMAGRNYRQTPYSMVFGTYEDFYKTMSFDFFKYASGEKLTEEELIKIIKKVCRVLGTTPSMKQFELMSSLNLGDIKKHFRNFGRAVAAADPDVKRIRSAHFTREKLLQILIQIERKTKRLPQKNDIHKLGVPTLRFYRKKFGSFRKALIEAGFEIPEKTHPQNIHQRRKKRLKKMLAEMK